MLQSARMKSRVAKTELEILKKIARGVNSPRSLAVHLLAENLEFSQLVSLDIDPLNYNDSHSFMDDYFVTKCLSKSVSIETGIDKKKVAFEKFLASEESCRRANTRISALRWGKIHLDELTHRAIFIAREEIRRILGPLSRPALDSIEEGFDFGPGATFDIKGVVTRGRKFSEKDLTVTPSLLPFMVGSFPQAWKETVTGFTPITTSRMEFVPKTSKTDRVICVEPTLNIFVQKGIGSYIRDRLKSFGLDLQTQEWNQFLASVAYDWNLSTIDLSAASDSISIELVKFMLPERWCKLLSVCRTPQVMTPNGVMTFEKWSSMGNGYTFELESLIFYGLIRGVGKALGEWESSTCHTAVYGDDLIIPNHWEPLLTRALSFLGFKVNSEKSFGKGVFHESCGADFFFGLNVRPVFFRWDDFNAEEDFHFYLYGNLLRLWASRRSGGCSCDRRILPAWIYCFTAVPRTRRCTVPTWDYATNGFVCNFDESKPDHRIFRFSRDGRIESQGIGYCYLRKRGYSGYAFTVYYRPPVQRKVSSIGSYIACLHRQSDFTYGREALRGRFERATTGVRYTFDWPNYGPWV